jgi:hypothetical protein
MRNLILFQTNIFKTDEPMAMHIDELSKLIIILDKSLQISIYSYEDIFTNYKLDLTIELEAILNDQTDILESITKENIRFFYYKNEEESIHIVLSAGEYIRITTNNKYQIDKLTEGKQVLCVEVSPNLEYIAVALSDFTLMLLSYEFELINCCALDDEDLSDSTKDSECPEASISWRGDTQYFASLYSINGGKKCLVRDTKLNILKGPARADNKVVFSVAASPVPSIFC